MIRINSKRIWLFRSGIDKETGRKKSKQTKYKYKWRTTMDPNSEILRRTGGVRRAQAAELAFTPGLTI
jgi:hypothetical protein